MLANNPTGMATMATHLLSVTDKTEDLAAREIPTFVLFGEDDNAWSPTAQADMAVRLAAQRTCIPAAAHNPNVEAPASTAHALTAFWNAVETRGALVLRRVVRHRLQVLTERGGITTSPKRHPPAQVTGRPIRPRVAGE
jgi:hypothetical protein